MANPRSLLKRRQRDIAVGIEFFPAINLVVATVVDEDNSVADRKYPLVVMVRNDKAFAGTELLYE
ncbi:hypothetical protein [Parapedobacter sp. 2B3]|uniref:hypothetical protein n=1 Tax=Parapedobacter sp. 2B3 TaxID=3342381 RepID=UPI0035B67739